MFTLTIKSDKVVSSYIMINEAMTSRISLILSNMATKFYSFSPIKNKRELHEAIKHIHFSCYKLCKQSFGEYLPNSGNIGVFCHYEDEYKVLIKIREELTESFDNFNQKYFRLNEPIVIPANGDVPETTYTYLYVRKPDPYRHHAGDVDFYLEQEKYNELKILLQGGKAKKGARVFDRADIDMIELYDPDIDALAYVSTHKMSEKARVKVAIV